MGGFPGPEAPLEPAKPRTGPRSPETCPTAIGRSGGSPLGCCASLIARSLVWKGLVLESSEDEKV